MSPLPRPAVHPVRLEAFVFRCPIETPVKTSFGTMRDRPALFVRVEDDEGAVGWGEVWCNFPACGAEHRARLLETVMSPLLTGRRFDGPQAAFDWLSAGTAVLAIQSGEPGPVAQVIAGIDIALWDLTARRAQLPLYRLFSAGDRPDVPVYVTGINPDQPERFALARQVEGHRAFKLKIGFGVERDIANLRAMRDALGPEAVITCDANQAWSLEQATRFARAVEDLRLQWFEEPMRVDAPPGDWHALAEASTTPLAGGENLQGEQFDEAIAAGALQVIQPDVTKWGGITGNLRVARAAVAAGRRYCPHYFGGGVALLSSMHVLAAAGGDGLLEIDAHPNANREAIVGDLLPLKDGRVPVPATPGLGAVPDLKALQRYRTWPL